MIPSFENLDQVTLEDIQSLVDCGYLEDERIDFKGNSLYEHAPDDWLKDISALSNTHGGCIILGISETDRRATGVIGVSGGNFDNRLLRLKTKAEAQLRPRIVYRERRIPIDADKSVVILATNKSRHGPHMDWISKKFWKRNAGGNEIMDCDELRSHFLYSISAEDIARNEHLDHVDIYSAHANELIFNISIKPSGLAGEVFDPTDSDTNRVLMNHGSNYIDENNSRIAFDGWHLHGVGSSSRFSVLRTGDLHARIIWIDNVRGVGNKIQYESLPYNLQRWLTSARTIYMELNIAGPYSANLTIDGCKGRKLSIDSPGIETIDRDRLSMPSICFEDTECDWFLKAIIWLHRLWNASGLKFCPIQDRNTGAILSETDFRRVVATMY